MRFFIFLAALFVTNISLAEKNNIECRPAASGVELIAEGGMPLSIPGRTDCQFSYELIEDVDGLKSVGIFLGPTDSELGLRTAYTVYVKPTGSNGFELAGDIPVAANQIAKGRYQYVEQEGGGLYLSYYVIKDRKITLSPLSKALMIEGLYCISQARVTKMISVEKKASCIRKLRATFEKPICVLTADNVSRVVARSQCSDVRL
jgi:hypothetical protein